MTPPQAFLAAFLREKADVYAEADERLAPLYTKYFGQPLLDHSEDFLLRDSSQAVFENAVEAESSATITTVEHLKTADLRMRYHLGKVCDTWKILAIDRECFYCQRTGQSSGAKCPVCAGEGWYDPRRKHG